MESTVPVTLTNLQAWTRPRLAAKIDSTNTFSSSHMSAGTWNLPAAKSTSKPRCLLYCTRIIRHLSTMIRKPAKTRSPSTRRASQTHAPKPSFMNIKSSKYRSTLMLARLQNKTNSLITLEKTHGVVESPHGMQLYT